MDSQRELLLYVDDEEQALKYFSLIFAKEYEVLTAPGAEQAWALVERHGDRLALVISDQRMPGRSGVDLLSAIRERCPRAVRLLTTAYSDLSSAIAAVNRGAIFAYVTKPWKLDELRTVVLQALQLHRVQRERDALLAEKLSAFQHLLLADRTRCLGMAAAALSGQVRRPLAAAAAWLRHRGGLLPAAAPASGERDLWPAVLAQSRECALLGGGLGTWLARHRGPEAPADVGEALAEAATAAGAEIVARAPQTAVIDRRLLVGGFTALLALLRGALAPGGVATVAITGAGGAVLTVRVRGDGAGVPDGDATGLAAYLAIHHHGGSVEMPAWDRAGASLGITLAEASDDGVDAFIAAIAAAES